MKTGKIIIQSLVVAFLTVLLWQCANPVAPTGGPADVTPPQVVSSEPPNNAIHFDKKNISITFNEFVELKQPNQQVIISPPLKENPEYKIHGKTLVISLQEELKPNTTYSIFFGDAIVDLTAGNPLTNYLYAFSTGDHIDTLAIGGEVLDAFTLQPQEDVFVMLYEPYNDTVPQDSLPMLVRPLYVSKTNASGVFQLRYLREEPYKIFALRDVNGNYLFDQPNEDIAFLDSLVMPEQYSPPKTDSLLLPDTTAAADSVRADTLRHDSLTVAEAYKHYYHLMMFRQIDSTQRLVSEEDFYPPRFLLVYKFPAEDPHFTVINENPGEDWKVEELNRRRDSLMVWVKNMQLDSLQIQVLDGDSILDTTLLTFARHKKEEPKRRRGKNEEMQPERISFTTNSKGRVMDLGRDFRLTFDNPLRSYDFSNVFFVAGTDTMNGAPFRATDSISRHFVLDYPLKEETTYEFIIPDSTLYDIYGFTNDSLRMIIRTKKPSDYGNFIVNVQLESGWYPYIIQLLDNKENVLRHHYVTVSGKVSFEFLEPGTYKLKAIQDFWQNRRWDTGEYLKKRQPENVFYFPAEVQVRANWDIEESWPLP